MLANKRNIVASNGGDGMCNNNIFLASHFLEELRTCIALTNYLLHEAEFTRIYAATYQKHNKKHYI